MKQGETRRKLPKDKHTTASWKKRDEARKGRQEAHAAALLLATSTTDTPSDATPLTETETA
jgi:hypothetical protein